MARVTVRPHQVRPHHTGSARVESLKTQAQAGRAHRPPTHLRLANAAVAVEREQALPKPPRAVRWARRPLTLSQGRAALALRQAMDGPIEVLVRGSNGHQGWRPVGKVMAPEHLRAWVREGFGGG